ncbi:MAG: ABC transporter substrate-binding protein [Spirosomataceae bacterium]
MNRFVLLLFLFCLGRGGVTAQILNDPATQQLVLECVEKCYNYEFKESEELLKKIKAKYPNHPVTTLMPANVLYWQHLPLKDNAQANAQYVKLMNQCVAQGEALLRQGYEVEGNFFVLAGHSFLAMNEADQGNLIKAVGNAKNAYSYMKKGFKLMEKNPEFYFSTGLFNYYIEQYPEDHSIVKPFMLFFQDGDKKLGLQQLEIAVNRAIFTKVEAAYYLVYIYLKHENNLVKALQFSTYLNQKYPNNPLYTTRHTEGLLLSGKFNEAEPFAQALLKKTGKVFPVAGQIFTGIIQEKFHKNDKVATEYYQRALKMPFDERFTKDYHAFAYCGLARIADRAGDKALAKVYYKKALSLAEYTSTKIEANRYLK